MRESDGTNLVGSPSPGTPVTPAAQTQLASNLALENVFANDPVTVARELLGGSLYVKGCGGIIVETEAYTHDDPASHSFRGLTVANRSMFGPAGIAYVYRIYGVHWCLNAVCGSSKSRGAVLIRGLQPVSGVAKMRVRRRINDVLRLCSGPGRLAAALGINGAFDGLPLTRAPFSLALRQGSRPLIAIGCRIGISAAKELPWRFGILDSPFLSRRFP